MDTQTIMLPATATTPKLQVFIDEPRNNKNNSQPYIAVLTHPHPKLGGDAHNNVVMALAHELTSNFNVTAIRFNMRGVAGSEGSSTWKGVSELDDVRAVLRMARERASLMQPKAKILLCAYSFGAAVGLAALSLDPSLADAVAIFGYPKGFWASFLFKPHYSHVDVLGGMPKLFVLGNHDDFTSVSTMEAIVSKISEPKQLVIVEGDHFCFGREHVLAQALSQWFEKIVR